jgi:hypothetical protein
MINLQSAIITGDLNWDDERRKSGRCDHGDGDRAANETEGCLVGDENDTQRYVLHVRRQNERHVHVG